MQEIYMARRQRVMEDKQANTVVVIFSGSAPMKSQDEAYAFETIPISVNEVRQG